MPHPARKTVLFPHGRYAAPDAARSCSVGATRVRDRNPLPGFRDPHIVLREERADLRRGAVGNNDFARPMSNSDIKLWFSRQLQVQLVTHAEVQSEFRVHFEIIQREEVVRPAVSVHADWRKAREAWWECPAGNRRTDSLSLCRRW